jgi:phosphate transporter
MAETYQTLLDEITAIEDRELGGDDVIKEENEDEADGSDYDGEGLNGESDVLLRRSSHSNFPNTSNANANRPLMQKRASIMHRLGAGWKSRRRGSALPTSTHEADLMEASVASLQPRRSSIEGANGRRLSQSADEAMLSPTAELPPSASPTSPARRKTSSRRHRASSDLGSSDMDRRASMSSTSSHERDFVLPRTRWQSLELVEMDEGEVPDFARSPNAIINGNGNGNGNGDAEMGDIQEESDRPVYMWTGSNDHATVMRIGFKKRVSANWLEAYALKQYVDLNLTAFEKILKK